MPARTKAKRIIRSFKEIVDFRYDDGKKTILTTHKPEKEHNYNVYGLDGEIRLGKKDWEDLGRPERIKVVIYSLDD
jgi:hypothetical protein